ncbi:hypothetical protein NKH18_38380 [Streptomyces sp. M10(2022)]
MPDAPVPGDWAGRLTDLHLATLRGSASRTPTSRSSPSTARATTTRSGPCTTSPD